MAKGRKKDRLRADVRPSVVRPRVQCVPGPVLDASSGPASPAPVGVTTTKKCCRSRPRCRSCPVVLLRAAHLEESGLVGKDLAKAIKRARAA